MNLHEELAKGIRCTVCAYLGSIPFREAEDWDEELARPARLVGHKAVVDALRRRGTITSEASVRRHRRNHAQ